MNVAPRGRSIPFVLAFALVMAVGTPALADPGDLDPSFGGDGRVATRFDHSAGANAVAIRPDGKIVAVGTGGAGFVVARYEPDGTLDDTFGGDGRVSTSVGNPECTIGEAVAIQDDARIVAAGGTGCLRRGAFALVRYRANGTLDASFGGDGRVLTSIGRAPCYAQAYGVAVQADGKIVAAGQVGCNMAGGTVDFALVRYNTNGTLDTSFGGGDGRVRTGFPPLRGFDRAFDVAIQANGKIVAAGVAAEGRDVSRFAVARYTPNGRLDPTFGGDGRVTTQPDECVSAANAVAVQADGRIVAAGRAGCIDQFALVRYDPNGTRDRTFRGDGTVVTSFPPCPQSDADDVAVQPSGRIVAAGFVVCAGETSERYEFGLARYRTNGSRDPAFGDGGIVTTRFACPMSTGHAVASQADGRIVAAGSSDCNHTSAFALARYEG